MVTVVFMVVYIHARIQTLKHTHTHTQALALCALIPNTQARQALEDQLHVRYALELSAAGELDQAMTQVWGVGCGVEWGCGGVGVYGMCVGVGMLRV